MSIFCFLIQIVSGVLKFRIAMCPPAHGPAADTFLNGNIENIFMYLDKHKPGSPLPPGLFEDINPYQHSPSHLPAGIWFLVNLTEKKENAFGIWEVKEEASEIFANSSISGWRTTLQFLENHHIMGCRTNWVMHEYKIILKKLSAANKEKEARAICQVFVSGARISNIEKHHESKEYTNAGRNIIHTMTSIFPRKESNSRKGSPSGSLGEKGVDGMQLSSEAEKLLDPWNTKEQHYMFDGDYLELDDLVDPPSRFCDYLELDDLADPLFRSSSSNNSSLSSFSDEYFDPDTLLEESQGKQGRDTSSKLSVISSVRPFEVVVQPASSGSLVSSIEQNTPKREARDKFVPTASNIHPPILKDKEKATFLKRNRLKHFCFMPFRAICKSC